MKRKRLNFLALALVSLLALVILQSHAIQKYVIQPRDFYGEFNRSQFDALNEIQDTTIRKKYASIVTEHWNGYDTTVLRFLTVELTKLHSTGKCSDSLLVLESPSHGEVEHTTYAIYDFKKQCYFKISVVVESIVKVGMSDMVSSNLADSIVYRQLNFDHEKWDQFTLIYQDCFLVTPNRTRAFLQFGKCPDDYDLGIKFIQVASLNAHPIESSK